MEYYRILTSLEPEGDRDGAEVIIERAGAPDVKGTVSKVIPEGVDICTVREDTPEVVDLTFIAFRDIRGIKRVDHNYRLLAH